MISHLRIYTEPKQVGDKPIVFAGETVELRKVPLGTVLIINAWNYPIYLAIGPLIGAIAGGNSAIVKMSEIAPHSAMLMSKLFPKYLDPECYQVVLGAIPESTALLNQKFDLICYTGNTTVGKIVHAAATKHLVFFWLIRLLLCWN
jgi:acyl-CoA reductase-like NAD-dependent aldehyde dehydrogenase